VLNQVDFDKIAPQETTSLRNLITSELNNNKTKQDKGFFIIRVPEGDNENIESQRLGGNESNVDQREGGNESNVDQRLVGNESNVEQRLPSS